jgi:hypothetical protein
MQAGIIIQCFLSTVPAQPRLGGSERRAYHRPCALGLAQGSVFEGSPSPYGGGLPPSLNINLNTTAVIHAYIKGGMERRMASFG